MTTTPRSVDRALRLALDARGEETVIDALYRLATPASPREPRLTILVNAGMHEIPQEHIHGELYIASQGNLDLSSPDLVVKTYTSILRAVAVKLRERAWRHVYLIPTGPPTLSLQIKLLVYHITRLSSVDLYYARGVYQELDLEYREYLTAENDESLRHEGT